MLFNEITVWNEIDEHYIIVIFHLGIKLFPIKIYIDMRSRVYYAQNKHELIFKPNNYRKQILESAYNIKSFENNILFLYFFYSYEKFAN